MQSSHTTPPEPGDARARILAAGEQVFAEYGYLGSSLLKVAKTAGTSESGVVRLFDSKEGVFLAVMEAALGHINERVSEALGRLPEGSDPVERLMVIAETIFRGYRQAQNKTALVFSENGLSLGMLKGEEGNKLMVLPGMLALIEHLTEPFRTGCAEGVFPGLDPIAGRELFFGMLEGTILGWLLSEHRTGHYTSTKRLVILAAMRRMLNGLRVE